MDDLPMKGRNSGPRILPTSGSDVSTEEETHTLDVGSRTGLSSVVMLQCRAIFHFMFSF